MGEIIILIAVCVAIAGLFVEKKWKHIKDWVYALSIVIAIGLLMWGCLKVVGL